MKQEAERTEDKGMRNWWLISGMNAELMGAITILLVVFGIRLENGDLLISAGVSAFLTMWFMIMSIMAHEKHVNGQLI